MIALHGKITLIVCPKQLLEILVLMNELKHFIPNRILFTLYCTLILPYLNYGILIWGNTCKSYLDKRVKLQKWAITWIRTTSNSHYRSHTAPIFAKYNVLNVTDMYTFELGVFMYRYSMNELPSSFKYYFKKRSDIHNYSTRHCNNYNLTKNKKTFSDHSVRTSGPYLWNTLENQLKQSKSVHFLNQFKQKLISTYLWFFLLEHQT